MPQENTLNNLHARDESRKEIRRSCSCRFKLSPIVSFNQARSLISLKNILRQSKGTFFNEKKK